MSPLVHHLCRDGHLCGHATLASADVLWEEEVFLSPDEVAKFETRSGQLTATRQDDVIWLDFPALDVEAIEPPAILLEAIGRSPRFVGRNVFDYLVELESAEHVRTLKPDLVKLATLPMRGVIVTSTSDQADVDIISRFFGPAVGVPEDPVTGSAHCSLATYWAPKIGKSAFTGYQASKRGGIVHVELAGERALIGGQAITVFSGELAAIADAPGK